MKKAQRGAEPLVVYSKVPSPFAAVLPRLYGFNARSCLL